MTSKILAYSLLIICILINVNCAFAQPGLNWQHNIGRVNDDRALATTADLQGNVYVAGAFEGSVDFDPSNANYVLTSKGVKDGYIVKYSATGAFLWVRALGGSGYDEVRSIATDAMGNVFVGGIVNTVGGSISSADLHCYFYSNALTAATLNTIGQADAILAKYDASGALVSTKIFGGLKTDMIEDIALDNFGNLFVTGEFYETIDLDPGTDTTSYTSFNGSFSPSADIFYSKFDNNLNFVFGKRIGGPELDNGLSIATGQNGEFFVAGTFSTTADFDPSATFAAVQSVAGRDGFIAKYDSLGNYIFVTHIAGNSEQYAQDINVAANGDIFLAGYAQGSAIVNYNTANADTLINVGMTDAFIAKFNALGLLIWANSISGSGAENSNSISIDNQNNVYVTGTFYSANLKLEGTNNEFKILHPITTAQYVNNIYLAKYSNNGVVMWGRAFGDLSQLSEGKAVSYSEATNTILLTGISAGTNVDFDPTSQNNQFTTAGSIDGFIAQFSACAVDIGVVLSADSLIAAADYQSYQWINCTTNSIIVGANQQIFHPTANGQYKVVLVGSGGCTDTSACIAISNIIVCSINSALQMVNDSIKVAQQNATYQWLKCPNYTTVVGATAQAFKPAQAGNYACRISLSPTCVDTSFCFDYFSGLNETKNNFDFKISPNPANNYLNVNLPSNPANICVKLFGYDGKELTTKFETKPNSILIDINGINDGMYFVQIIDLETGNSAKQKFVKK